MFAVYKSQKHLKQYKNRYTRFILRIFHNLLNNSLSKFGRPSAIFLFQVSKNTYLLTPLQLYAKMVAKILIKRKKNRRGEGKEEDSNRQEHSEIQWQQSLCIKCSNCIPKDETQNTKIYKNKSFLPIKCKTGGTCVVCLSPPSCPKIKREIFPLTGLVYPY